MPAPKTSERKPERPGLKTVSIKIFMEPTEHERLRAHAAAIGKPLGPWLLECGHAAIASQRETEAGPAVETRVAMLEQQLADVFAELQELRGHLRVA